MGSEPAKRGLILAAPSSGSGKTLVTLALLRALKNAGYRACGAKAGPDFIDPQFHQFACGMPSVNLDPWAMDAAVIRAAAADIRGDLLIVEAMMGLFDGAADGSGSAADLALLLDLPVVLVLDCAKQSHSIAALIKGFMEFRQDIEILGVILNKVGSERHETMLRKAIEPLNVPVLGAVYRDGSLVLPERHLGLHQAGELPGIESFIEGAAAVIQRQCDLEALVKMAGPLPVAPHHGGDLTPLGQRIAIARDVAFSFAYPHLLDGWVRQGSSISFFSPLGDEAPSEDCDAIYLPGGYPELHAGKLASAENFKVAMRKAAGEGKTIYGECGGYMVLGRAIVDGNGAAHHMLDLLNVETSFATRKLHLGYRRARATDFVLGDRLNCHEFHYSTIVEENGAPLFEVEDALGQSLGTCGLRHGLIAGSYMHVIGASS